MEFPRDVTMRLLELIPTADEDPPLIVYWNPQAVQAFVNRINAYEGAHPAPFPLPVPLTCESFQAAVMENWRASVPNASPKVETFFIPGTAVQYGMLLAMSSMNSRNPWWDDVDSYGGGESTFPLARLYTLKPGRANGELEDAYPVGPNLSPWQ